MPTDQKIESGSPESALKATYEYTQSDDEAALGREIEATIARSGLPAWDSRRVLLALACPPLRERCPASTDGRHDPDPRTLAGNLLDDELLVADVTCAACGADATVCIESWCQLNWHDDDD